MSTSNDFNLHVWVFLLNFKNTRLVRPPFFCFFCSGFRTSPVLEGSKAQSIPQQCGIFFYTCTRLTHLCAEELTVITCQEPPLWDIYALTTLTTMLSLCWLAHIGSGIITLGLQSSHWFWNRCTDSVTCAPKRISKTRCSHVNCIRNLLVVNPCVESNV